MSTIKRLTGFIAGLLVGFCPGAGAEDIDLFLTGQNAAVKPNLLVVIDNSANWDSTIGGTTKKLMEHRALVDVLTDDAWIDADTGEGRFRVGFMIFAHSNSPKGGKVIQAVEELTDPYQDEIKNMLWDDSNADGVLDSAEALLPKSNNSPYALSLHEAYLYFRGAAPRAGTQDGVNKDPHDPAAIADDGTYDSPAFGNCGPNFVLLLGNGDPDTGEDSEAEAELDALGGVLPDDPLDVTPDDYASNWSDEYARYMASADVVPTTERDDENNVKTFVVDVHDPNSNQSNTRKHKAARAWLDNIGKKGEGGTWSASSTEEIKAAIEDAVDRMLAVDSVFAASTLPVSVNVRGTHLNQVYMGVFRPDEDDHPRWDGNLKLYQLQVDSATDTLYLADQNGEPVRSGITGFVVDDAASFWTHDSTFWGFRTDTDPSDLPDGPVVEKGGAAQQLRDNDQADYETTRNVYTCTGSCGANSSLSNTPFDTQNGDITMADLGVSTSSERDDLIEWVKGNDNFQDEDDDGATDDVRASIHGDVLHSRPAVVNYNNTGDDGEVVAFYGANDGMLHAVRGGKGDAATNDGDELWSFVPEEFFPRLDRLRQNDTVGKEYFADGGIAAYTHDANEDGDLIDAAEGDRVYLFATMRRGGRFMYALDATHRNNPKLLWQRDFADSGWGELGQTWSTPEVHDIAASDDPVVVFGLGYDPASEDPDTTATPSQGRGIMVVNARTGGIIWQAGPSPSGGNGVNTTVSDMTYPIPSDVTVIDRDNNGEADRIYVGDTGGQVWRVDIAAASPSEWKVWKLASVGEAADLEERKFLFPPDVVYTENANGVKFDAVLIGSGDREDPFDGADLSRSAVDNRFYMFKDYHDEVTVNDTDSDPWVTLHEGDLYDVTDNTIQEGDDSQQQTAEGNLTSQSGWMLRLTNHGEKVVTSAVTLNGVTFFSTNEPPHDDSGCANKLGTARHYMIDFEDARAVTENNGISELQTGDRFESSPGGGFPPSPVPVMVEIDGEKYQAVISGTDVNKPPGTELERRHRVFWHKEME